MHEIISAKSIFNNQEAAEYTGFSPRTLNNSRSTGLLGGVTAPPFRKIGKSIRYSKLDLDDWLDQFEPQTNTGQSAA